MRWFNRWAGSRNRRRLTETRSSLQLIQLEDRCVPAVVVGPANASPHVGTNLEAAAAIIRPITPQPILFGNSLTLAADSITGPQGVDPAVPLALTSVVQTFVGSNPSPFPVPTAQSATAAVLQQPVAIFNDYGSSPGLTSLASRIGPLSFGNDSGYAETNTAAAEATASTWPLSAGSDQPAAFLGVGSDEPEPSHQARRPTDSAGSKGGSPVGEAESTGQRIDLAPPANPRAANEQPRR